MNKKIKLSHNFMLSNELSNALFYKLAKDLPIFDFHCHLSAKEIYENKKFKNITEIWLYTNYYKWRLMRFHGIDEKYITGLSDDYEKFFHFALTIENAIGNPIYHWCALELQKYFNIDWILTSENCKETYEKVNLYIDENNITPIKLINDSNVKLICTTDSPYDSLEFHKKLKNKKELKANVIPGFRPDELFKIGENQFISFLEKMESRYNLKINSYDSLIKSLNIAINEFKNVGSCISDHGFNYLNYVDFTEEEISTIFNKAINKLDLTENEINKFISKCLVDLAGLYIKNNFVMQIHFGAIRNNNELMHKLKGVDMGFDVINHQHNICESINKLLDKIFKTYNGTPKMIFFNLDPSINRMLAAILNNFQVSTNVHGKIQLGASWWFNDTEDGMIQQLKTFSEQAVLGDFVGMLTDSRSFTSYARHDYFRRILCEFISDQVYKNKLPNDAIYLAKIIKKCAMTMHLIFLKINKFNRG